MVFLPWTRCFGCETNKQIKTRFPSYSLASSAQPSDLSVLALTKDLLTSGGTRARGLHRVKKLCSADQYTRDKKLKVARPRSRLTTGSCLATMLKTLTGFVLKQGTTPQMSTANLAMAASDHNTQPRDTYSLAKHRFQPGAARISTACLGRGCVY